MAFATFFLVLAADALDFKPPILRHAHFLQSIEFDAPPCQGGSFNRRVLFDNRGARWIHRCHAFLGDF